VTQEPSIFALDFGTTNSLLAAASADTCFDPAPLDPLATDPTILRSALHYTTADDVAFGQAAVRRYVDSGLRGRLLRSIKRHLGAQSFEATRIGSTRVTIEELAGTLLRAMRERACAHYGKDVDRVVLGRPARFSERAEDDELAVSRLADAARLAGFRDVWFCFEPVAAAYDFASHFEHTRTVLIADLGGGTSDFTIVRMRPEAFSPEDVLAVGGISVAGDAIDGAVVREVVAPLFGSNARYRLPTGSNVLTMPGELLHLLCSPARLTLANERSVVENLGAIRRGLLDDDDATGLGRFTTLVTDAVGYQFYEAVEAAKVELSSNDLTQLSFPYPGIDLDRQVSRDEFDTAVNGRVEQILAALAETLTSAGLAPNQIEIACLTGGTSMVPVLETALRTHLPAAQVVRLRSHHSVVQGLAVCARSLERGAPTAGLVRHEEHGPRPAPKPRARRVYHLF
jgi:hypothetical chaperone protein